jgi:hypothetical protein
MAARPPHRLAALLVMTLLALPEAGCSGPSAKTAATPAATTSTSTPSPSTPTLTTTGPGPMTPAELSWLTAFEKLSKQMEDVYTKIPTNLTPKAMASTANKLRECSRQLARMGSPSARLQPVYALVKKACQAYDTGAQCFATAASLGITVAGSAADRRQSKAIDCGFAASGKGSLPMADAENKAEEIKMAAGG